MNNIDDITDGVVENVEIQFIIDKDCVNEDIKESIDASPIELSKDCRPSDLDDIINDVIRSSEGETSDESPRSFSYLIRVPKLSSTEEEIGDETEEIYLKSKLGRFMAKYGLSSETCLNVRVSKSHPPPINSDLNEHRAQLTDLREIVGTGVIASYSDGKIKIMDYDGEELLVKRLSGLAISHLLIHEVHSDTKYTYYDLAFATVENFSVKHCAMRVCIDDGKPEIDVDSLNLFQQWRPQSVPITAMFSNGSRLITGDSMGHLRIYSCNDGPTGEMKEMLTSGGLLFTEKKKSDGIQKKRQRTVIEGDAPGPLRDVKAFNSSVSGICGSQGINDKWEFSFFASSVDQSIKIFDLLSMEELARFNAPRPCLNIDFNESTNLLATGHDDGRVIVWEVLTHEVNGLKGSTLSKRKQWGAFRRIITSCRWCPTDNDILLSTLADGTVKILDIKHNDYALHNLEVTPFEHGIIILCGAWTETLEEEAGSRWIYTGATDGVLRRHQLYF